MAAKRKSSTNKLKQSLESIKNIDTRLPKNADVFKKIEYNTTEVIRASLSEWQNAYEDAKDPDIQGRTELIEIYETLELDPHVSAITETVCNSISQRDFNIYSNGEIDEEKTNLFKKPWFDDFVSISLDTTYWGYSGIQLGNIVNDEFEFIKSIPRQNICPEKNAFKPNYFDNQSTVSLDEEPYNTWVVRLFPQLTGDQYKLGKYNKISKMFILKRDCITFWSIYNELFGNPYRVTKTDITDEARRQNAIDAMENMTSAAFSVVHTNDEVEFISNTGGSGNGFNTFQNFIDYANKEMSKAILGSTMVVEDGSSRSQADVHDKNTKSFINSRAKWFENVVNNELIPRMYKLGFPIGIDDIFKFKEEQKTSPTEWAEILQKISPYYETDAENLNKMFGVEFSEKQIKTGISEVDVKNEVSENKIMNFYNKIFKR